MYTAAWITYIIVHGVATRNVEQYLQLYLASTLLMSIILTYAIKLKYIKEEHLTNGILIIGFIHITLLTLQSAGMSKTGNPFFTLTGADTNPNVTAIATTIAIPFVCKNIKYNRKRYPMLLLLVIMMSYIIALRCRTAYIGVFVMSIVMYLKSEKSEKKKMTSVIKAIRLSLLVMISVFSSVCLYLEKKESADGRFFIWKRACEMIIKNPMGYGYGLYEKSYNLYQAEYFMCNKEERKDSTLKTACGSAYNDILEHTVQGGIIGGLFYIGFFCLLILKAKKEEEGISACVLVAISAMSFFNSIYCSITPWYMTMVIVANVSVRQKQIEKSKLANCMAFHIITLLSLFLLYNRIVFTRFQILLKIEKSAAVRNISRIESYAKFIGTSEAYWQYLAECHEINNEHDAAHICYNEARKYTSTPALFYRSAICYERDNEIDKAIQTLRTATFMLPANLLLKYHIMTMYHRNKYKKEALDIACDIIRTPTDDKGNVASKIKEEASSNPQLIWTRVISAESSLCSHA